MKRLFLCILIVLALAVSLAFLASAQGQISQVPDKKTFEKMMRFGKEAYLRGKYEDAKAFFRKAIEADPTSKTAWTFYDISSIMALGKKVEKQVDLLASSEVQIPEEKASSGGVSSTPTVPVMPEPKKEVQKREEPKTEFKIMHDEGC